MAEIRVVEIRNIVSVTMDWLQTPTGLLDETHELATAVAVALGTDRTANPDDPLPDIDVDDRRGWWGDLDAQEIWGGWPIGSRLWLLERAKITDAGARDGATVARAETYIREAIRPFIEAGVATKMTVMAVRNATESISAVVVLYRGPKAAIELRFASLWDAIEAPTAVVSAPRPVVAAPGPSLDYSRSEDLMFLPGLSG